jgi:2,4-dienoyl-CoA reductase-like NADH-dependent reductase (Old Yellow Enzyme family)/thioredoxin reductase
VNLTSLFRPGRIGKLEVANRVVKSPQSSLLAHQDGTVSTRLISHYRRLAEGGAGLIIVEYTYIDDDAAKAVHAQIGISRREHIPGLGWLADEVHAAGAKVGIQLAHCGRQKFLGTAPIKSASDVSWGYAEAQLGVRPQPMTLDEIQGVVRSFGDAAHRAYCARFDLVEVHAGHGYLLTNFLSPHTNKRQDQYGGSFENRSRLVLEAVADIRAKVPRDFPLSVRLSVTDYEPDGFPVEETVALSRLLERLGVDVIHASGGHHDRMQYETSPWFMPRALHRDGWTRIKRAVSIPIMASGSLVEPAVAAEILDSGTADFVSLGRAMLADPDWVIKTREGRLLDIVPCIRCNDGCLHRASRVGRSTGCSVNPNMGMEYRYAIEPVAKAKRVAVAGGGPAGLRAAAMLADRGHRVTLFEPNALGGRLIPATRSPYKRDLAALLTHLVHQVASRNVFIVPSLATPDAVRRDGYDLLFVATGAKPRALDTAIAPNAPPIVHAIHIGLPEKLAAPVVVIGGGLTGCDTALWLAGCRIGDVTVVEAEPELLSHDEVFTDKLGLPAIMTHAGVRLCPGARAVAVTSEGVCINDPHGAEQLVPARTVIVACGYQPERQLADELAQQAPQIETVVIGTARAGARVMDALHDAFFAARRI